MPRLPLLKVWRLSSCRSSHRPSDGRRNAKQTPRGVNAFLWTKLPSIAQSNTELYFSPILEDLTTTKPKPARGGIIAEQMGLGKIVISPALILRNPAPPLPVSGTALSSINATPAISSGAAFWDHDMYTRTSASKKKCGRMISRGHSRCGTLLDA
jgi:hypothetical protein